MMSAVLATRTLPRAELPAWQALLTHWQEVCPLHLRQLFANDPQHDKRFAIDACGIYLDYSKNHITAETVQLLIQLAETCRLRERLEGIPVGILTRQARALADAK